MTQVPVRDEPQLAFGERIVENATLLMAVEELVRLKGAHSGARSALKAMVEENGALRGKFRLADSKWIVNVRHNIVISISEAKPVKVRLPRTARGKPLPETETVRMSVNGADGQPVRRPRGRPRKNGAAPDDLEAKAEALPEGLTASVIHEPMSDLARDLIDEARRAPQDEDGAREQAEAAARLALRTL